MRRRRRPPGTEGIEFLVLAVLLVIAGLIIGPCSPSSPSDRSSSGYRVTTRPGAAGAIAFFEAPTSSTTTTPTTRPTTTTTIGPSSSSTDLGVFRVTCYGPPLFPAGQTTASGAPVGPGSFAVDPAVIRLGTRLEVEGYGVGVANDRGSKVRGRHVDVWRADPYHDCPIRSARVRVVTG